MSRVRIQWNYTGMHSAYAGLEGTTGVFSLTVKAEWKVLPDRTLGEELTPPPVGEIPVLFNTKRPLPLLGSIHRYVFEIRNTGVSSCHVALRDHFSANQYLEFDLPTTPEDDFTRALESLGEAKIEHPFFANDKNAYQEDVSLDGVTTRVTFNQKPTTT